MTTHAASGSIPAVLATIGQSFVLLVIGSAQGYFFRVYLERREQRQRERIVGAFQGGTAQSEEVARGLEAAALKEAHKGFASSSSSLLAQAQRVREEGRKGR